MTLKERLEQIFSNDYPGTDVFLSEVIKPIFGDEIEPVNIDLAELPQYAERARKAGLKHIKYIGDLTEQNYNADNIVLLDVTVDDSVNIERSRVNIQQLVRSIVQQYQHMLIVFHYENTVGTPWRFSYAYKAGSIADTTLPKRYTYVFGKDYRGRTAAERFNILTNSERNNDDFKKAFSVEALSDEFFDKYRNIYADFVELITGKRYEKEKGAYVEKFKHEPDPQFATTFDNQDKTVRDYVKKMFGRIVFLYFLQRKGWLYDNEGKSNPTYMHDLFANSACKDNFLDGCLETLFFRVLNTDKPNRDADALSLPGGRYIPYLNGGLFQEDDIDRLNCVFPADYFQKLFDFLDSYNFTIDENDREDAEIGIDPEMLGRIFENLLEDNKDKGAFYTPKEIVDYMCRESIIAYLQDDKFSPEGNGRIREFIETQNVELLNERQRDYIEDRLIKVKICDPAIGSGAFPMGLVNLLSKLFIALRTYKTIDQAKMKRYIMQNSIHGVDIEKGAVDIARLRFWLAMVVDEVEPQPLPNLNFKIMQGNSLLEYFNGLDLSTLMKREPGRIDFITDAEREQLRRDLNRYYAESNHDMRDKIMQSIKNTVVRMILNADPNSPLSGVDVSENDKFFLWHTWFSDVFDKGGFDIVIGNPPYIKEATNRSAFDGFRESNPYYQGKMDLWYGFACNGIDILKPGGNVCFIATNNWITNDGASKLRNCILKETQILQFIDFNEYMIFEDSASIQTMIFLLKKNNSCMPYKINYKKLIATKPRKQDAIKLLSTNESITNFSEVFPYEINPIELVGSTINFIDSKSYAIIGKMNSGQKHYLNENDNEEVFSGIDVLQDRLNKRAQINIPNKKVGDGIFVVNAEELEKIGLTTEETKFVRPYYTSKQIKRYYSDSSNVEWILYTPTNMNDIIEQYPNIKRHLDQFARAMTSVNKPYGLHRTRVQENFEGAKILSLRKCVGHPQFSYVPFDSFVSRAYMVIKTSRFDLKFLTGLLNSKLIEFWLLKKGKMQGANFQVDKAPLLKIPIATKDSKRQKDNIADIVSGIIALKSANKSANTEALENQIDHIVYHLYDLTYDEVLIVDPQTPITREEYENFSLE
ncbi:MAG: Eco57I restriction-modification methylase domain-containing protein [Muribaculum sp.]|nr:Eco57I restriction-modification methylase domain-containing protein [Muribaculum sp.]